MIICVSRFSSMVYHILLAREASDTKMGIEYCKELCTHVYTSHIVSCRTNTERNLYCFNQTNSVPRRNFLSLAMNRQGEIVYKLHMYAACHTTTSVSSCLRCSTALHTVLLTCGTSFTHFIWVDAFAFGVVRMLIGFARISSFC